MNRPIPVEQARARNSLPLADRRRLEQLVRAAALRVAPSFEIRDMVAVNPFLGYSDHHLLETSAQVETLFHVDVLPTRAALREDYRAGAFDEGDLLAALLESNADSEGPPLGERALFEYLAEERATSPASGRMEALLDQPNVLSPESALGVVHSVTRFLAARYDRTVARWRNPMLEFGLFESYLRYASRDRSPEILGLRGFRKRAKETPTDALEFLGSVVETLGLDEELATLYFGRLLARLNGWASYLRHHAWQADQGSAGELPELLAILAFVDTAPNELLGLDAVPHVLPPEAGVREERRKRLVCLRAKERAFSRNIVRKFVAPEPLPRRASAQAVFCIDVRSERLRRHLETTAPGVETYGFAGFFGLPVSFSDATRKSAPHCPPLLRPARDVALRTPGTPKLAGRAKGFLQRWKASPVGALNMVESVGFGFGVALLSDAVRGVAGRKDEELELDLGHWPVEDRVRMAAGILKNLGLRAPLARLVLLVGHDSHVANNPQAAGLSCGACAGHGGDRNALLAVALLNDPAVRAGLADAGTPLPDDVFFAPFLHETTTDRVSLVPGARVPESHRAELDQLLAQFEAASAAVRSERAPTLDEGGTEKARFVRRGRSISEVRPEWALAGNAGFIVARRERTRGAALDGRTFLHSYDEERDVDGSVLELILTAPAIVGSWINLQYYASSVAPSAFGSGTKTLHNVVGGVGVMEGNDGDLAVGLSRESVSNGSKLVHDPLRLQLIVEASEDRIAGIVEKHRSLGDLVRGEWVVLYALDRNESRLRRYDPKSGFSEPSTSERILR